MILRALSVLWTSYAAQLADHLWQSTLFVVLAAILALALRKNQGRIRYWVWLTASVKFLIPFSLLIALGSHLAKPQASTPAQAVAYSAVEDLSQPFSGQEMPMISEAAPSAAPVSRFHRFSPLIVAVWFGGIIVVLLVWATSWIRVSLMVRGAVPLEQGPEVEALRRLESSLGIRKPTKLVLSRNWMEPGIFGILRPVLIWPEGISQHLDGRHVEAILAHEICHARRHDNLTAVLHMLVESAFWFHPLVWWVGTRLEEERERACDEEVRLLCNQPHVYAESILRVCKFCSESPLVCVSGITGADLKKRIMQIVTDRTVLKLTFLKKLILTMTGLLVIAVPIVLGQAKAAQRMSFEALQSVPAPIGAAAEPANLAINIVATWQGTLHVGRDLRFVVKITRAGDGTLQATFYNIDDGDLGAEGRAASSTVLRGASFEFRVAPIDAHYEGKVSADGASIIGIWTQHNRSDALSLLRATPETAWTIPTPEKAMALDADPEFEVATIKPSDPNSSSNGFHSTGRHVSCDGETLDDLIWFAYGVHLKEISGSPAWSTTDRYDISGVTNVEGEPDLKQSRICIESCSRPASSLSSIVKRENSLSTPFGW